MKLSQIYITVLVLAVALNLNCLEKTSIAATLSVDDPETGVGINTAVPSTPPVSVSTKSYDVIVLGAGTSGIAAAIQAARLGAHVALLEETDWVGGQLTSAGVGSIDGGQWLGNSGIYKEFLQKVQNFYVAEHKSYNTCYYSTASICIEPHVGRAIFLEMIKSEPNIDLRLRERVDSVIEKQLPSSGNGATSVITGIISRENVVGRYYTLLAPVVIDATEFGDVLQKTSQPYRIGTSMTTGTPGSAGQIVYDDTGTKTTNAYGQRFNLAGNVHVQDITYVAVVRKYPHGVPADLIVKDPPPGYETYRTEFAQVLTANGNASNTSPRNWAWYAAYRGLPDSSSSANYTIATPGAITRTAINLGNDYPVNGWFFNPDARHRVDCSAKLKTLAFIYYMQHDLGLTDWSVADDEGYDTGYNEEKNMCPTIPQDDRRIEMNMPVRAYVRESLRMVGVGTEHVSEIFRQGCYPNTAASYRFPSSIAMGDYPIDQHGYYGVELSLDSEADLQYLNAPNMEHNHSGPFEIPFESFISKNIDGLIAAEKNISQSRYVSAATREHPSTMVIGQAAGTIAAIAALNHKPPRDVSYAHVQQTLHEAGAEVTIEDAPIFPTTAACPN